MVVKAVNKLKIILGLLIVSLTIFSIGCSSNSYVVSDKRVKKIKISADIPEELRASILKLYSSKNTEKIYGAMMLGKAGRKALKAVPYLTEVLINGDNTVKGPVIMALSEIGDPRAADSLIVVLEDRRSPLRAEAAAALGKLGHKVAVDALLARLTDKTIVDRAVKMNSIQALAAIGDKRSVEPLIESLKYEPELIAKVLWKIDPRWQERAQASKTLSEYLLLLSKPGIYDQDFVNIVRAIGKMGPDAITPLFSMLMDENILTRKYASEALAALGWKPGNESEKIIYHIAAQNWDELLEMGSVIEFYLSSSLVDSDILVRWAVAGVLNKVGWEPQNQSEEINYLVACKKWDELMKIGAPAAARLSEILRDNDLQAREIVAKVLIRIGEPSIKPLIYLLKDKRGHAREIALSSLDKIDPDWRNREIVRGTVPGLISNVHEHLSEVQRGAIWALGEIGDPRAVLPLISALKDDDQSVRLYVVKALGKIDDVRIIEPLIGMLNDRDSVVRGYSARVLGKIKDNKALEPLIAELTDKDSWPRASAQKALKKIDPNWTRSEAAKKALPDLIIGLMGEDKGVKMGAVTALEQIADPKTIKPLIAALQDEDEKIRTHAAKALEKITGKTFGEDFDAWNKWLTIECKNEGREYCYYVIKE